MLLAWPALHAATLDPAVLPKVQAATFEVVIPRPESDPLTYEKPLPLDQLPFHERNDKYNSVGTAFALDDTHYVTAAHVLMLGIGSLTGEPALRGADGRVYAIGQITRFSLQQDFVEFTLQDPPHITPLQVNTGPAMNGVVYTVGNALGTGIVIRDGLYTSQTPEEANGRWKWLRFSAAASPGNSGGPLLDQAGKIIGVVLMKSANENLNYALPIGEVMSAPANLAVADKRMVYNLDVIENRHTGVFKMQFPLPKSFADFSAEYLKLSAENDDQMLQALLAENAQELFPKGQGASRVLHDSADNAPFPGLLHRGDDGVWRIARPNPKKSPLPLNGYVTSARLDSQMAFHLRKPDDVSSRQLYSDPKMFMDLLLKGVPFKRSIGAEAIKITSLGRPVQEQTLIDSYHRQWQIKIWTLPYRNSKIIVFLLPVPDGYAGMFRTTFPTSEHDNMTDLKAMTDFICLAYQGTLAQWRDYLAGPELLPDAIRNLSIRFDYGQSFAYQSKRLDFAYTPALQAIDKNSLLTLGLSYFNDHGQVVWDVSNIKAKADASADGGIGIVRRVAPSSDLDDDYHSQWKKLARRSPPYDGVPYRKNDVTAITTVGGAPAGAKPGVLYQISYAAEGAHPNGAMKKKLSLLLDKLRIKERF